MKNLILLIETTTQSQSIMADIVIESSDRYIVTPNEHLEFRVVGVDLQILSFKRERTPTRIRTPQCTFRYEYNDSPTGPRRRHVAHFYGGQPLVFLLYEDMRSTQNRFQKVREYKIRFTHGRFPIVSEEHSDAENDPERTLPPP